MKLWEKVIFKKIKDRECKNITYKFLMRKRERSKGVIQALFEIESNFKFIIDYTYKFKFS